VVEICAAIGISAAPVLRPDETVTHPHVQVRETIQEVTGAGGNKYQLTGPAPKLSRTPLRIRTPAPQAGTHTREVLVEAGFSDEEIHRLSENQVIHC
jgi:crotonobetainyl-CoA:carnitine CoA-transferase CaiB-like acyl-CoA transferase